MAQRHAKFVPFGNCSRLPQAKPQDTLHQERKAADCADDADWGLKSVKSAQSVACLLPSCGNSELLRVHCACPMGAPCCIICAVISWHIANRDEKWMRLALAQARQALALGEVPVGAVAVYRDRVIGAGFNRKERDQDPTLHAETIALRQAAAALSNWRLSDVTLYCTLEPCPMCAGAMLQARLKRLVYGAKDLRFGADGTIVDVLGATGFNHRVIVTENVLADEAQALLQEFFQQLRRTRRPNGSQKTE